MSSNFESDDILRRYSWDFVNSSEWYCFFERANYILMISRSLEIQVALANLFGQQYLEGTCGKFIYFYDVIFVRFF